MPKGRKQQRGQSKRSFLAKTAEKAATQAENAGPVGKAAGPAAGAPGVAATPRPVPSTSVGSSPSPIGLVNLGHTCYFNAMVQVLVSAPPVQAAFLSPDQLTKKGPFGGAMREVVEVSQGASPSQADEAPGKARQGPPGKAGKGRKSGCYSPARLHNALAKLAPHLKRGAEQDSHEALRVLLDGLDTEEHKRLSLDAGLADEAPEPVAAADSGTKVDQDGESPPAPAPTSVVQRLFGGELASTVVCAGCGHTSTAVEPFMCVFVQGLQRSHVQDLSLPMRTGDASTVVGADVATSAAADDGEDDASAGQTARRLSPKQRKALMKEERKEKKLERAGQRRGIGTAAPAGGPPQPEEASQTSTALADIAAAEPTSDRGPLPSSAGGAKSAAAEGQMGSEEPEQAAQPSNGGAVEVAAAPDSPAEQRPPNGDAAGARSDAGTDGASDARCDKLVAVTGAANQREVDQDHEPAKNRVNCDTADGDTPAAALHEPHAAPDPAIDGAAAPPATSVGDAAEAGGPESAHDGDEDGGETMEGLGGLFDETGSAGYVPEVAATEPLEWQGFTWTESGEPAAVDETGDAVADGQTEGADGAGAAVQDSDPAVPSAAPVSIADGGISLESCLAAFFAPEAITWACPAELKEVETSTNDGAAGAPPPVVPLRRVSFSEAPAAVRLIPGSREARGLDLDLALGGLTAFTRPLRHLGAELVVSAQLDHVQQDLVTLEVKPKDYGLEHVSVLAERIECATVNIAAAWATLGGPEVEQVRVQGAVRLLMDCVADIVEHEGVDVLPAMTQGMRLLSADEDGAVGTSAGSWRVEGTLPEEVGEGSWVYPLPVQPDQDSTAAASPMKGFSSQAGAAFSAAEPGGTAAGADSSEPRCNGAASLTAAQPDAASESAIGSQPPAQSDSTQTGTHAEREAEVSSQATTAGNGESEASAARADGAPASGISRAGSAQADAFASPFMSKLQKLAADRGESGVEDEQANANGLADDGAKSLAAKAPSKTADCITDKAPSSSAAGPCSAATCGCGAHAGAAADGASSRATADVRSDESPAATGTEHSLTATEATEAEASLGSRADGQDRPGEESKPSGSKPGAGLRRPSALRRVNAGAAAAAQRPATKRYAVRSAPPLLTAHLKRFEQDGKGRLRKIEGWVSFPFVLDVGACCDPTADSGLRRSARYQLLGVVEHRGESLRTGHYVAYVQRGTTMPNTFEAHLRCDAAPTHAAEEDQAEPTEGPELPQGEQPNGLLSSAAAAATPVAAGSGQGAASATAQSGVDASRSAAESANSAQKSSEPPKPEALSWFLCTDEIVKPVSWDAVAKCKAYILLYMRTQ